VSKTVIKKNGKGRSLYAHLLVLALLPFTAISRSVRVFGCWLFPVTFLVAVWQVLRVGDGWWCCRQGGRRW